MRETNYIFLRESLSENKGIKKPISPSHILYVAFSVKKVPIGAYFGIILKKYKP